MKRGNYYFQTRGRCESVHCLGEIQEAAEEMSHARDRPEDTNGHLLSLHELYFKRYNRCSLRRSIQKKKSKRSKIADRGSC